MLKLTAAILLTCSLTGAALAAPAVSDDLPAYVGQYALADGRVLTVSDASGRLTAQIGKPKLIERNGRFTESRPVLLKPAGFGRFVSASTQPMQLIFEQGATGEIAQVRVNEQVGAPQGLAQR